MVRAHRHQPARVRDRRDVCRYVGHRARDLAAWADRGALFGAPGELEGRELVELEKPRHKRARLQRMALAMIIALTSKATAAESACSALSACGPQLVRRYPTGGCVPQAGSS